MDEKVIYSSDDFMRTINEKRASLKNDYDFAEVNDMTIKNIVVDGLNMRRIRFVKCKFSNAQFVNCKFYVVQFIDCTIDELEIIASTLDMIFENSKIKSSRFNDCSSIGYLGQFRINRCELDDCKFRDFVHTGVDISKSEFHGTVLLGCVMIEVCASYSSFSDTIIYKSEMSKSSFFDSKVIDCRINYTNMSGSSFNSRMTFENVEYHNCIGLNTLLPEEGSFIAYKAVMVIDRSSNRRNKMKVLIAKLLIPADAKRYNATGLKCRASKAMVLGFYDIDKKEVRNRKAMSAHNLNFLYEKGKMIEPEAFDENRLLECSNGIHFFMSFDQAVDYANENLIYH